MKRLLLALLPLAMAAIVLATVLTIPAAAQKQRVTVRLADGTFQQWVVEAPQGATLQDIRTLIPQGEPVAMEPVPEATTPTVPPTSTQPPQPPQPAPESKVEKKPKAGHGERQKSSGDHHKVKAPKPSKPMSQPKPKAQPKPRLAPSPLRDSGGAPTPNNPTFTDALPGPSTATGVPNFIIRKFRVPIFLLPIYQAAGTQYGVRWEILAAINEIETDYGRNLNVSSAGALGWMQFMPATWRQWGVDANKDKRKDPFNPADAIFAAARYLKAAGAPKDMRKAIFAYNHADWYVDSVMLRARMIAGLPADLVGSLTGLTQAHFPVYAKARYADDVSEQDIARLSRKTRKAHNASALVDSHASRRSINIYSRRNAPVIAVNDGVVKKIGENARL
ncbi:MAG TPA: lytic murein transglycosylase, partial [Thermoanaerobaculia bacterium]